MKFFPVTEEELDAFGAMNLQSNVYMAVGTGLIAAAVGVAANHAFAEKPTAAGLILFWFANPLFVVLGLVALWMCRRLVTKRDAIWKRIVASTETAPG